MTAYPTCDCVGCVAARQRAARERRAAAVDKLPDFVDNRPG